MQTNPKQLIMDQPQPPRQTTHLQQSKAISSSIKPVARTKRHEAVLKIKQTDQHIDLLKKRNKYLEIKDDEHRSKTIQHERKISTIEQRRESVRKEKQERQKYNKLQFYSGEAQRERNKSLKQERSQKLLQSYSKVQNNKLEGYSLMKIEQNANDEKLAKFKNSYLKEKREKRRSVSKMEEQSKQTIIKYKQFKANDISLIKTEQFDSLMKIAKKKEKELNKLSLLEEQMIKKNAESMQVSHLMKSKLKQILGDGRKTSKLPSIRSKSNLATSRESTEGTQIFII